MARVTPVAGLTMAVGLGVASVVLLAPASADPPAPKALAETSAGAEAPAAAESRDADPPPERIRLPIGDEFVFEGRVVEEISAGGYRYLAVEDDAGVQRWVATLAATAPSAARIRVATFGSVRSFRSPILDRTFDRVFFGFAIGGDAAE
ncbi:MAG: hypothetical protein AAGF12_18555 [Myxococcota bacterium]